MRRLIPSRREVLLILLFIFISSLAVQVQFFLKIEEWATPYTTVSEERLYCSSPYLLEIKRLDHGNVSITPEFDSVEGQLYVNGANVVPLKNEVPLLVTLKNGKNEFRYVADGKQGSYILTYYPAELYEVEGNTKNVNGTVTLQSD